MSAFQAFKEALAKHQQELNEMSEQHTRNTESLIEALKAPRKLVRDEKGRAVGSEIG